MTRFKKYHQDFSKVGVGWKLPFTQNTFSSCLCQFTGFPLWSGWEGQMLGQGQLLRIRYEPYVCCSPKVYAPTSSFSLLVYSIFTRSLFSSPTYPRFLGPVRNICKIHFRLPVKWLLRLWWLNKYWYSSPSQLQDMHFLTSRTCQCHWSLVLSRRKKDSF